MGHKALIEPRNVFLQMFLQARRNRPWANEHHLTADNVPELW